MKQIYKFILSIVFLSIFISPAIYSQKTETISFSLQPSKMNNGYHLVYSNENFNLVAKVNNKNISEITGFDNKTNKKIGIATKGQSLDISKLKGNQAGSLSINQCVECKLIQKICTDPDTGKPTDCYKDFKCTIVLCTPKKQ